MIESSERRAERRVRTAIYGYSYIGGIPYLVRVENISCGGMRARLVDAPERLRTRMRLHIVLPGSEAVIACWGQVVYRQSQSCLGLRFTELDQGQQRLLGDYVSSRSERGSGGSASEISRCAPVAP